MPYHGRVVYCPDNMWVFPLVTVFAPTKVAAKWRVSKHLDPYSRDSYEELARDCLAALERRQGLPVT